MDRGRIVSAGRNGGSSLSRLVLIAAVLGLTLGCRTLAPVLAPFTALTQAPSEATPSGPGMAEPESQPAQEGVPGMTERVMVSQCASTGQRPGENYLGDAASRGGSDAVNYFLDDAAVIAIQAPMFYECDGHPWEGTLTLPGLETSFQADSLVVAPNLMDFTYGSEGIAVAVFKDWGGGMMGVADLLQAAGSLYAHCDAAGVTDYASSLYAGQLATYVNCGSPEAMAMVYALAPKENPDAYWVLVELHFKSAGELATVENEMQNTSIDLR